MTKETYAELKAARLAAASEEKPEARKPVHNRARRRRLGHTKTAGAGRRRRAALAVSTGLV
ncbi:hypothetical protein, partial [Mycolicibacterium houstonense]